MFRRFSLFLIMALWMSDCARAGVQEGDPFLDFTALDVVTRKLSKLSTIKGDGLLFLYFWHSALPIKYGHLRTFNQWYQKYQQHGLRIVGISWELNVITLTETMREVDARFPSLFDREQLVAKAYGVSRYPTTFLIDKNGVVRFREDGASVSSPIRWEGRITRLLRETLGESGPPLVSSAEQNELLMPLPHNLPPKLEASCRVELAKGFAEAAEILAAERMQNRQFLNRARIELREAAILDPQNSELLVLLAKIEEKCGLLKDAYVHYLHALKLNPLNRDAKDGVERLAP